MSNKIKKLSLFLILPVLVYLFYGNVLKTWFQQDEWDWIGRYTYYNSISKVPYWEAFKSSLFPHPRYRFTPFFDAAFAAEVDLFGLNFTGYAVVSLILHTINSILAFHLAKKVTNNKKVSLLASILFATSSIGQKAITWTFTSTNTQTAAAFSFLAIIAFIDYLKERRQKTPKKVLLFTLAGLWFKETTLALLFIMPAIAYIKKAKFKHTLTWVTYFTFAYLVLRFILSRIGLTIHSQGYPDFGKFLSLKQYLNLAMWTPARAFVDSFLTQHTLINLSSLAIKLSNTKATRLFIETKGVNAITLLLFLLLLVLFRYSYRTLKIPSSKQSLLVSLIFIFGSIVVHFLLTIRGSFALSPFVRSRDLYFTSFGASLATSILINQIRAKKWLGLFLALYFFYHFTAIQEILRDEIAKAQPRKSLVSQIYKLYPDPPKKVIFFGQSDTKYYGHSVTTMPFQTGFGRTLLVWYTIKNHRTTKFVESDFLYYPLDEGYTEEGQWGFGYFRDPEKLKEAIAKYSLDPQNIIAFEYNGSQDRVRDISTEIKERIQ